MGSQPLPHQTLGKSHSFSISVLTYSRRDPLQWQQTHIHYTLTSPCTTKYLVEQSIMLLRKGKMEHLFQPTRAAVMLTVQSLRMCPHMRSLPWTATRSAASCCTRHWRLAAQPHRLFGACPCMRGPITFSKHCATHSMPAALGCSPSGSSTCTSTMPSPTPAI